MRRWAWLCLVLGTWAAAGERAFPFTFDSATLEPGERQVQFWETFRSQRFDPAPYLTTESRFGLAAGVTKSLDTLLLLDATINEQDPDLRTIRARVSSLWKYSFLKATDALGVSGLGRVSLGLDGLDLEARLVLDKQLGPVLIALNASVAYSPLWNGAVEPDLRFEESLALGYRVGPVLVGVEARVRTAYQQRLFEGTAYYAGPTLSWSTKWFFATLAWHAQLGAYKAKADRGNGEAMELRDNERFVARFLIGWRL